MSRCIPSAERPRVSRRRHSLFRGPLFAELLARAGLSWSRLAKPAVAVVWCALLTFLWLDRNNQLAQARLLIPPLQSACLEAQREEGRLLFQIDRFEQPLALQRLLQQTRYQHLHTPRLQDVLFLTSEKMEKSAGEAP